MSLVGDRGASHRLAVIAGDGVGPEVMSVAVGVATAAAEKFAIDLEFTDYPLGGEHYLRTGDVLPASVQSELAQHDAILLGAVGTPDVPPGILERGLLLKLRFDFDQYVNRRPVKLYEGVVSPLRDATPENCDFVVIRENTEGLYVGAGGTHQKGTPAEVATQESINTWAGVERIIRYAFEAASARSSRLTLSHKTNVLEYAGDLWDRTFIDVAADFPNVRTEYQHVDALCLHMVNDPSRFDVIVTENLFGDIVTDLGAAIQGGLGLAASGNLNPTGAFPSMFEPVHGSAPDIAGNGWANPVAAVLSVAMCFDHLGHADAAATVENAAVSVLPDLKTMGGPDMGMTTRAIGDAIVAALQSSSSGSSN